MLFFQFDITNILVGICSIMACAVIIIREARPDTKLNYSKFAIKGLSCGKMLPSRTGMFMIYCPAFIISLISACQSIITNAFEPQKNYRVLLVSVFILLHYSKRLFEVRFIHHYSGHCKLRDCFTIASSYVGLSVLVKIFTEQVPLSHVSPHLTLLGVVCFIIGECANFYHHVLLKNLRQGGSKEYKIPKHGLFEYVWCPHYLAEMVSFFSIAMISQHWIVFILSVGSSLYLATRAYNTREWYRQRFDKIPARWCLVPFIF
ncbi:hypothetical protein BCV72DRAFT_120882 [Rhizopus microsporus var. microsporus]|uniref:3-oxo-5-alpha-steroid 4-dehydrogenase C-terminal domain-containing protein n=2 Tax=Rhizopus microsporus TaxID=58291 RepID=A0A2G4SYV9_RHIZD|nr:uncharacterized protein RHIMIDRAFT_121885 [Rhizopus microsporus ATCC 52813]ORE06566.1 hypothetical protein BCV72DRAFT_120882 [Rhizopus microsporus var. microsporus]PHZ13576.1 hypothetical protein RHIMIDRAFT_121885 [Rhizopus microsporus ATCC 52813]